MCAALSVACFGYWMAFAYANAKTLYYGEPTKHYSAQKELQGKRLAENVSHALELICIAQCVLSIALLFGIIWQCR